MDDGKGATHVVAHAGTGDGDGRRTDKVKWAAKTPGASAVSAIGPAARRADEWARVDESRGTLWVPTTAARCAMSRWWTRAAKLQTSPVLPRGLQGTARESQVQRKK